MGVQSLADWTLNLQAAATPLLKAMMADMFVGHSNSSDGDVPSKFQCQKFKP